MKVASKTSNKRIKPLFGVDLIAKEAQYHKSCRREYFKEIEEVSAVKSENSPKLLHSESFNKVAKVIELEVIENCSAMFTLSFLQLYKEHYMSAARTEDIKNYYAKNLCVKIKSYFRERVCISLYDQRKGTFVRATDISNNEAENRLLTNDDANIRDLRNAALYLRKIIQEMPKWSAPVPTSVHTLKSCSPDLPEEQLVFYRTVLHGVCGPFDSDLSENLERKAKAMASDAVYNTSRGMYDRGNTPYLD